MSKNRSNHDSRKLKIAIHSMPWLSRRTGHRTAQWCEYWVCVGANPLGPRGGACGNAVGVDEWHGRYRTKEIARRVAERLAADLGAELIN